MESTRTNLTYPFLRGGGELGVLIRGHDWSHTPLGPPERWPHSLRASVSNLLHNGLPMLVLWGNELTCLYNDAFLPSLDPALHPAIGRPARAIWAEGWGFIGPLLEQVLATGQPVTFADQPVRTHRNGQVEEVYWTFCYSLIQDDNGQPGGVLVTCLETTQAVRTRQQLQQSEQRFRNMVEQAPVAIALTRGEDVVIESINAPMLQLIHRTSREEVIGKKMLEVLPEFIDQPILAHVLQVQRTGVPFQGSQVPADLLIDGSLQTRYFDLSCTPVYEDNSITSVLHVAIDVTRQVTDRLRLEENEVKLQAVIQQAPASVAIGLLVGRDLVIDMPNRAFIETVGKGEDIAGKRLGEVMPELESQPFLQLLDQVFTSGQPYESLGAPLQVLRNGQLDTRYFNVSFTPLKDSKGEVYAILDISFDVTDQIRAQKRIQQSEARYRTLFNSMNQGFCVLELLFDSRQQPVDYRFLETNPVFEKQTGLQEPVGKTARELVPGLESEWFKLYGNVALTGESIHITQGSEAMGRWFDVYAFQVGDPAERKVALLFTDITERKMAEEAIRRSEQNLRNMILQSPIAMCILRGPHFVVEIANERMYELWGRRPEALLHRSIFEGLPEAKNQGYEELLKGVYTTGQTFSALGMPVELPRPGGVETVYINLLCEAFRESDGTISGIMIVATDVTQQVLARHRIEEVVQQRTRELALANDNLLQANKELQRSNANLEEFAHAASHDLKEPIRKINFFTHHLKEQLDGRLNESELRSFHRIENAAERMGHLVDDLLLYSHVSHRPHQTEMVALNEQVQRVLEDLELDIAEKKAVIEVGALPTVQGFRRQLQQLFQNLLSNALKYSKTDVPPRIHISATQEEVAGRPYHVIKVADNGIGFEQQYADRIFQMFARLHGKQEFSGTGVGLSIVKKVVENHNGLIKAESAPGAGAAFRVFLPARVRGEL